MNNLANVPISNNTTSFTEENKINAVNALVDLILNSQSSNRFSKRLDRATSADDPTPLRKYFESGLSINKENLDPSSQNIYFDINLYSGDTVSLIDCPSTVILGTQQYVGSELMNYENSSSINYYYTPLMAALQTENYYIIDEIMKFRPSTDYILFFIIYHNDIFSLQEHVFYYFCSLMPTIRDYVLHFAMQTPLGQDYIGRIELATLFCDDVYNNKLRSKHNDIKIRLFYEKTYLTNDIIPFLQYRNILTSEQDYIKHIKKLIEFSLYSKANLHNVYNLFAYLLDNININIRFNESGDTVLMLLARSSDKLRTQNQRGLHKKYIKTLTEIVLSQPTLDINKTNDLGETALSIAIKLGKKDFANALMKYPGINLEKKNIYGTRIHNTLKRAIKNSNNNSAPARRNLNRNGRTTRRNNYRNMMRSYERASKPRIAMTMSAKTVGRRQAPLGPNLGKYITSFIPSAVPNE